MAAKIQMLCIGILLPVRIGELSMVTVTYLCHFFFLESYCELLASYLVCIQLLGW